MEKNPFKTLLSPIQVGSHLLKNRVIMGSMHMGMEEQKTGTINPAEKLAAFYEERAKGGVALIVTGGFSPNKEGALIPHGAELSSLEHLSFHKVITERVHAAESKILLQILHAGRYALHPQLVAPSALGSPISPYVPHALSAETIDQTISDFIRCAALAKDAGYDGVEIMGSEGYLINQFLAQRSNQRTDQWGETYENRMRFPIRIASGIREQTGKDFLISFRLSCSDFVEGGSSFEQVVSLAKKLEESGVSLINTGIGWHESRTPTIAMSVPRAAFTGITAQLRPHLNIPVVASNRINTPEVAEQVLTEDCADLISMARPFLADPEFVAKAEKNEAHRINVCIACNQACLDQVFSGKSASCLVNPRAGRETQLNYLPASNPKTIAIVGAGPAGLSTAYVAALRGHHVTLFDQEAEIGGQLRYAVKIPGKSEFHETLRFYEVMLKELGVSLKLGHKATLEDLADTKNYSPLFDEIVLATGVTPRPIPLFDESSPSKVLSYLEVLRDEKQVGERVAVIGMGGIAFDVALYLIEHKAVLNRQLSLLQRSSAKVGKRLGKTTGWIHLQNLKTSGVQFFSNVNYEKVDETGLHFSINGQTKLLEIDHVIIAAGQESFAPLHRSLKDTLKKHDLMLHLIGGARETLSLDAKHAIAEGAELAARF